MDKCYLLIIAFILLPISIKGICLTSSTRCPNKCSCDYRHGVLVSAVCSGQNLTSVPSTLPVSLEHLDLSRNKITKIQSDIFGNCNSIAVLHLSFNRIRSLIAPSSSSDYNFIFNKLPRFDDTSRHYKDFGKVRTSQRFHETNGQNISTTNSVIENGSFSGLISLHDLILHHNLLQRIDADTFTPLVHMKSLDLSFNRLQHLDDGAFIALRFLERLNLQYNILSPNSVTFSNNLFDDLESLKELNLHNNFPISSSSFKDACYPDKALSKLLNLERLLIDGYFSSACVLGVGFRNLTKLSFLDLTIPGMYFCNIEKLPRMFFSNISTTRDLEVNLIWCSIRFIDSDAFSFLPTLTSLNLEGNRYLEFEGFENGSVSLEKTRIKVLNICHIHHLTLIKVDFRHLRYLYNTSLEVLIMKHNFIFSLDFLFSSYLPKSLKELDISHNKIIYFTGFSHLFGLFRTHLEIFNISAQIPITETDINSSFEINVQGYLSDPYVTSKYESEWNKTNLQIITSLSNNTNLRNIKTLSKNTIPPNTIPNLWVSRNYIAHHKSISGGTEPKTEKFKLKSFPNNSSIVKTIKISSVEWFAILSKFCPKYAKSITLKENKTFVIWVSDKENIVPGNAKHSTLRPFDNGIGKMFTVPLPKNLRRFYASKIRLGYAIPHAKIVNNDVLEIVDISNDFLTFWEGPITGKAVKALKVLNLSHNYCQAVSKYFFKDFSNLRKLSLSYNSLSPSLAHDDSGDTFSHLWLLEYLDLAYNNIGELSRFAFQQNKHLKILLLSHNVLNQFSPNLFQLHNLTYLDLSDNVLYSLSQNNIEDFDIIQETSNVSVNLLHNPLRCDCSTEFFITWYRKTLVTLTNSDRYTCLYVNGSIIPFHRLGELYTDFYRQCLGQHYLTVTLVMCVFVTAVYLLTGLMFYYKYLLYFHLYITKQQFLRHFWQPNQLQMRDVYLVFDNQDIEWRRHVIDVLIPNLTRYGISFHVAEVGIDEPSAGRPIRQVVEESVLRGKKTLVLLTEDVFLDEENQLAVSMARIVQDRTHCQVLMFLGAEKLKVKDLSPHIYHLLSSSRIIKYLPADPTFWNRLRKDIKINRILGRDTPSVVTD